MIEKSVKWIGRYLEKTKTNGIILQLEENYKLNSDVDA